MLEHYDLLHGFSQDSIEVLQLPLLLDVSEAHLLTSACESISSMIAVSVVAMEGSSAR